MTTRVREEGLTMVANVLESFAQLFPQQFPSVFNGVLESMLKDIVESNSGGPDDKSDVCIAAYLHVMARLFFQNWDAMAAAMFSFFNGNSGLLCALFDIWFDKFDCMSLAYKRKLSALAMCNLLQSSDPQLLSRLPGVVLCVTSVLAELEADKDVVPELTRHLTSTPPHLRTEVHRVHEMVAADPATGLDLREHLLQKMQQCAAQIGQAAFDELLRSVPASLLEELQRHGSQQSQYLNHRN
jgi:hypothetical protein